MKVSDPSPQAESLLQIGEVAKRVGLSLRTVRYYEEMGLLVPHKRTEGGFRLYTDDQVQRLKLIKRMKPLGFSVQEMGELLHARDTMRDVAASPEATTAAGETLRAFAKAAAQRCDKLRDQLAAAEAFADQVAREGRRARRTRSQTPKP